MVRVLLQQVVLALVLTPLGCVADFEANRVHLLDTDTSTGNFLFRGPLPIINGSFVRIHLLVLGAINHAQDYTLRLVCVVLSSCLVRVVLSSCLVRGHVLSRCSP